MKKIILYVYLVSKVLISNGQQFDNGALFGSKSTIEEISYVDNVPTKPNISKSLYPIIGFIDSGVNLEHPQIKPYILKYKDFSGHGKQDNIGHGTNVVLAYLKAEYDDKSPFDTIYTSCVIAKIVDVKDSTISKESFIEALYWLKEQHVDGINISLGFTDRWIDNYSLCEHINEVAKNIPIFMAAGNLGDLDVWPACCAEILPEIKDNENFYVVGDYSSTSGKCATVYEKSGLLLEDEFSYNYNTALNLLELNDTINALYFFLKADSLECNTDVKMNILNIYSHFKDYKNARHYVMEFYNSVELDSIDKNIFIGYSLARLFMNERDFNSAENSIVNTLDFVMKIEHFQLTESKKGIISDLLDMLRAIYLYENKFCKIKYYTSLIKKISGSDSGLYREILIKCK